ncbi:hypothetical protein CDD80_1796 [Ophiocordyceps camponoti-rufipedis]|uniref:SPX domain-containing protein n=1 Tax=Ophiocordyceps camponoti-rufipedis TaxID=2004952 RepID=A0A2C5YDH0_9HYPO|nr:hypothetical protein CDD80_1796 [Ophiocordyceps camponoti-rufipedis]
MKFGQQLERESIPEWRLHNLDYNSLKHEIKAHTSTLHATPTAIPGHPDLALCKFEDGLYIELEQQHNRLDLFVSSKADEISRRLDHLDSHVHRWLRKHADEVDASLSLRRQRKLAKYERELLRCGRDILHLSRFSNAQVIAFRKILKKYRKWTGSVSLTARFNQTILSNPKSFTRRDWDPLQTRHDEILADVRSASSIYSEPSSPSTDSHSHLDRPPSRTPRVKFDPLPPLRFQPLVSQYWNEYDDGSDAGVGPDDDAEYAIYVHPDDRSSPFPGLSYVRALTTIPYEKAKQWLNRHTQPTDPLLQPQDPEANYGTCPQPSAPPASHDKLLARSTAASLVASLSLTSLSTALLTSRRARLRLETDALVTAAVLVSLVCACGGLGLTLVRDTRPGLLHRALVCGAFVAACLWSGVLLVLVIGSAP